MYIYIYIYIVYIYIYIHNIISIYLSIDISLYLSIYLSIYRSLSLSISIYLSISLSIPASAVLQQLLKSRSVRILWKISRCQGSNNARHEVVEVREIVWTDAVPDCFFARVGGLISWLVERMGGKHHRPTHFPRYASTRAVQGISEKKASHQHPYNKSGRPPPLINK